MQSAKDTFYVMLRDRLAGLNGARTMVLRGVTRPGVVVEENELVAGAGPVNAFCMRWTGLNVAARGALPLVRMECEIRYRTDGSAGNGGMDRGRLLAAMDAELVAAVSAAPQSAAKRDFTGGVGVGMRVGTRVFWGDAEFGPVVVVGERLERVAKVEVFAHQETGEL